MYLAFRVLFLYFCYFCAQEIQPVKSHVAQDFQWNHNHGVWFDTVNKLYQATEYYGKCDDDFQCEWLGTNNQCKYGHCQCQDKFRWYKGKCVAYSGLNEKCTSDIDCYDGYTWNSMICLDNTCVCNDGFQNRDDVDCRKMSKANGRCALTIDCPNGYACQVGICKSLSSDSSLLYSELQGNREPIHSVINSVTKGYREQPCHTDTDCKVDNSECYNMTKTCVCKTGYFQHNNTCEAELGVKTCENDEDCYVLEAICSDMNGTKQCRCRDYWFYSKDNRKCVKTMLETNWNCLSSEWCYALGIDSYCSSNGTCKCSAIATLNQTSMVCKKERDSTLCRSDEECNYVKPHSTCVNEKCVCEDNYQDKNGVCKSALGGSCTTIADCETIEHAVCSNHTCICDTKYVESQMENTLCLEEAKIGEKCQEDIQCMKDNARAACSEIGICECNSSFRYINFTCEIVKYSEDYCTNSKQCHFGNQYLICRNSKCQCPTKMKVCDNKCIASNCTQTKFSRALVLLLLIIRIYFSTASVNM